MVRNASERRRGRRAHGPWKDTWHTFVQTSVRDGCSERLQEDRRLKDQKNGLTSLEQDVLQKQVFITNINFQASAQQIKSFLEARYGAVVSVKVFNTSADHPPSTRGSGNGLRSFGISRAPAYGGRLSCGRASVEFEGASAAQALLEAAKSGGGKVFAAGIGHRNQISVRAGLPRAADRYKRSGGQLRLDVLQVDVGALLGGGAALNSELRHSSRALLVLDYMRRCLVLRLKLEGAGLVHLQSRFKHVQGCFRVTEDGSLLYTLKQPPAIRKPRRPRRHWAPSLSCWGPATSWPSTLRHAAPPSTRWPCSSSAGRLSHPWTRTCWRTTGMTRT